MNAQQNKLWLLMVCTVLGFAGLGLRLFDLQVNRHEEYRELAEANTVRLIRLEPVRGQILDIHGTPLAVSTPVKRICANPSFIGPYSNQVARALAPILGMTNATGRDSYTNLLARISQRTRGEGKTNVYSPIKQKVSLDAWQKVRSAMTNLNFGVETNLSENDRKFIKNLRLAGIFAEDDQIRSYPNKSLAAHVVGFVGLKGKPTNELSMPDGWKLTNSVPTNAPALVQRKQAKADHEIGLNGIEMVFNSMLTGIDGWRQTERDRKGREILKYRDQEVAPRNGMNVVLTLDAGIQHIVEEEIYQVFTNLHPISVSCTVVRPRTGEIVAMATVPTYDPNEPAKYTFDSMRNRVICDVAEPGSTFKIVPVSAALSENKVSINEIFFCEHGHFNYGGHTLHEAHSSGFGNLSVAEIIIHSSNIGAAKVGIRLGDQSLYSYMRSYGLGVKTGLPLPGEVSGIVHPVKTWSTVSLAQIPMGHGVAVTPLQMVMIMSAIANNGVLMKPMLVDRLVDENGALAVKYSPQSVGRVISEKAAKDMLIALKGVPTREGTAEEAGLEHYTVAGKTGTAEKNANGHYLDGKYFSSFIGFFPAENPELCISVVVDDPPKSMHFGGKVAGPAFHKIAERSASYFNVKPDKEPSSKSGASSVSSMATVGASAVNVPARKTTNTRGGNR